MCPQVLILITPGPWESAAAGNISARARVWCGRSSSPSCPHSDDKYPLFFAPLSLLSAAAMFSRLVSPGNVCQLTSVLWRWWYSDNPSHFRIQQPMGDWKHGAAHPRYWLLITVLSSRICSGYCKYTMYNGRRRDEKDSQSVTRHILNTCDCFKSGDIKSSKLWW